MVKMHLSIHNLLCQSYHEQDIQTKILLFYQHVILLKLVNMEQCSRFLHNSRSNIYSNVLLPCSLINFVVLVIIHCYCQITSVQVEGHEFCFSNLPYRVYFHYFQFDAYQ
eukprot:NODE_214_length_12495_cov_0.543078.p8 type:complete len:110 gc:universal NODE_214_length_12495_cov_0.543078:7370-7041(-)